ncbi:LacI family DNA-binding transcriptional regulator [Kribbella sp. CA-293567]|uniref:LacI family DNA-binding transcriptional regulator n=1 Tax=Kribbella sp. CA-293567 TaxID=3002436 RepID=UPI0022DD40E2|nr:LacI family DNA-binding transcriptional regulator [Kribbella sp. CA-293567]WBQ02713.1 LacI family DNA-binding transcriptional regulator [Kribbella sp. CA-293567]
MTVTIRDVARLAGVSASTVSRALSLPDVVNVATRARVEHAAQQLGYQPNKAARGLITGRTGNIGLVVPDLANPFFPSVVKGVQARARANDVAVFLADTDEDATAEVGLVRALAKQVDGLILCSPRASDDELVAVAQETNVVLVNRLVDGVAAVTFDNEGGMRQAIAHLAALGHRRIAWVGGPATSWSNAQRALGLRVAAQDHEVELLPVGQFAPTYDGGMAAADQAVATGATAVVTYNDLVAIGLLARLHARGIDVPGDLSVLGIDDIAMAGMARPALSSVRLPKQRAGEIAVEFLLALLDDPGTVPDSRARGTLPGELMVRDSTGVAAGPARA